MPEKKEVANDDGEDEKKAEAVEKPSAAVKTMSKKARRKASRLSVAALKQLVKRPDVVEV